MFGGKNPNGVYVPLTEDEQEVLDRLIHSNDLQVVVHGWGIVEDFQKVAAGDARLGICFKMLFKAPMQETPIPYFDLELQTRSGFSIFKKREVINVGFDEILYVKAGDEITISWDIQIKALDPKFVKMIKPGSIGLTSRLLDKDNGKITTFGNMKLDEGRKRVLQDLKKNEEFIKEIDKQMLHRNSKGLTIK